MTDKQYTREQVVRLLGSTIATTEDMAIDTLLDLLNEDLTLDELRDNAENL